MRAMNCGKVEEPSSSQSRYPSTARYAAISAILTAILSKSDRAPTSRTVNARPGRDADLNACGTALKTLDSSARTQNKEGPRPVEPVSAQPDAACFLELISN